MRSAGGSGPKLAIPKLNLTPLLQQQEEEGAGVKEAYAQAQDDDEQAEGGWGRAAGAGGAGVRVAHTWLPGRGRGRLHAGRRPSVAAWARVRMALHNAWRCTPSS